MSLKDEVQSSMEKAAVAVGVALAGGSLIWVCGYDAGFRQGIKTSKPSVVLGDQVINNSININSGEAGALVNKQSPKRSTGE
jgi:hypothetical protein